MKSFLKKRENYIFFSLLFILYLVVTLFLFHRQTVNYDDRYVSDMPAYVYTVQGITIKYNFPYPIMFWIARFFSLFMGPQHALAVTVTGLNGLTVFILKYYFDKICRQEENNFRGYMSTILVFMMLFVSMLFPLTYLGKYNELLEVFLFRYKGVFTPNPFHNATYLAARPFATIAFFLIVDILQEYEQKDCWFAPKYIAFAFVLLVATMTKPSFTLVLAAICGIVMLVRLFSGKLKGMKAFWQLGVTFIPSFLALLYQYRGVFIGEAGGEEKGIGIGFLEAWKTASDNIPVSILLAIAFPLVVLLFQGLRVRKSALLLFAWQFYLAGLLMLCVFYEKGYRMPHINFAWGYMYGLYFLFIASLLQLVRESRSRVQPIWKLTLQWIVFAAHLVCGADYFRVVINGGLYL